MYHPFRRFPLEIRTEIWLAALPQPRLVRLREHITEQYNEEEYNKDLFSNYCYPPGMVDDIDQAYLDCEDQEYWVKAQAICHARTSIPSLCKIDPGLQHFQQPWLNARPSGKLQTQLERYNFSSSQPSPELPFHLLTDCEDKFQVFEATRRGYLWSSCPIPALLHACRESRHIMERAGYELTFRHRSSGPKIWFNFRRDTLYLCRRRDEEFDYYDQNRSLDRGSWNMGQLSPDDMKRVERLAVGGIYSLTEEQHSDAIRLFGNLKEYLHVLKHRCAKMEGELEDPYYLPSPGEDQWGHVETENNLWRCLDYPVADMFSMDWIERDTPVFRRLQTYLRVSGGLEDFSPSVIDEIETSLEKRKEEALMEDVAPWSIPKVRIVQVVTEEQAKEVPQHQ